MEREKIISPEGFITFYDIHMTLYLIKVEEIAMIIRPKLSKENYLKDVRDKWLIYPKIMSTWDTSISITIDDDTYDHILQQIDDYYLSINE